MRIDAHQHYWKVERGDYGWITPDLPVLYRDFLPSDLEPHLGKHRLDGTVLVQAAPTLEETRFILELADQTPSILGVVGWLDLFDPEHRRHYEDFRKHAKFVGFRIMIQEMEDPWRVLEPAFVEALRGYAADQVPVDLLVLPHQLDAMVALLGEVPNLKAVVDHLAKPPIRSGEVEPWRSRMQEAARYPGLYCKLSGMVTEAEHNRWKPEDFTVYVQEIVRMFGPGRVMFGSDWPVCLLSGDYDDVARVLAQALPKGWGEREYARLYGETAKEFYGL